MHCLTQAIAIFLQGIFQTLLFYECPSHVPCKGHLGDISYYGFVALRAKGNIVLNYSLHLCELLYQVSSSSAHQHWGTLGGHFAITLN